MKYVFTFLLLALLTSCGGPPKENTDYNKIIGSPIKIENLEIAQYDFPFKMNWDEASQASTAIGDGWRIPTVEELNLIIRNERRIEGFKKERIYWSSSSVDFENDFFWTSGFLVGDLREKKSSLNDLRLVRTK